MKAIVTVGISASGKSTFAKEWAKKNNAVISNRDDLRFSLTGASDWSEYKFNKQTEAMITAIQLDTMTLAAKRNQNIIMADTNLNKTYRDVLIKNLTDIGFDVEIKTFPITLEEAWRRDSLRVNGVGHLVIYKQYQQWLEYTDEDRRIYVPNNTLPPCIVFDIDGTLAVMKDRKPYEWDKVDTDHVRVIIRSMLHGYQNLGFNIVIVSGRDSVCREKTLQWLEDNDMIGNALYMRPKDDMRDDRIVKSEIALDFVAHRWNIRGWVDDRPKVVRMLYEIGIPNVICVADQNLEF